MAQCAAFQPLGGYVANVLAWVDCQTLGLGEEGYRALGPGSAFGMALTGLLTIYIALIGYRLLLGGAVTVREGVVTALKIGFVLALASQWPAWRVLVYDVATKTPEAAASGFLGSAGLNSGGSPMLAARIDGVNGALAQMVDNASSARAAQPVVANPASGNPAAGAPPANPAQPTLSEAAVGSVTSAIGTLDVAALAGLVGVRVVLGLLLALGPVFIACLLFETTWGLFTGWLRVIGGAMLGAVAVPVVLAAQMALIEPQVLMLRELLDGARPVGALPQQILATSVVFALVLLGVLVAMARVGLGFALPKNRILDLGRFALPQQQLALPAPEWSRAGGDEPRSRAQRIADAAQAIGWREERLGALAAPPMRLALPHAASNMADAEGVPQQLPLGQSGRRTLQRQSIGARRRDEIK
jgi:type IV secretion system protein VirB6